MDKEINGLHLHVIKTQKFKTITISLKFTNLLEENTAYKRTMISFLMASSSKKYPNNYALARALDYLYGAVFSTKSSCKGQSHVIHTYLEGIDPSYIDDDHYLIDLIDILQEIIMHPNVDENGFDRQSFEICKDEYALRFEEDKDDKNAYATEKLFEYMGENTPLAVESYGKEEQVKLLDPLDLKNYYFEMLEKDRKDLYIVGNINDEQIEMIEQKLCFPEKIYHYPSCYTFKSSKNQVLEVIEDQNITQTRLLMGYTINGNFLTDNNVDYVLLNGILGGFSHSLLFKTIREKYSLCYSIDSHYDAFNGVITINAGIEDYDIERVKELISQIIEDIILGNFDEELLEITKTMLINSAKVSVDDPYSMIAKSFNKDLCNLKSSYSNIEALNALTKAQICNAAKSMKRDTVFILRGSNNED